MNDNYIDNLGNRNEPIVYADTVQRYQIQAPLGISWPIYSGSLDPSDLYNSDSSLYLYYPSGLHRTAVGIQQRERYGGLSFTLLSGSVNLFVQLSEYFLDPSPVFVSAPYTVSGEQWYGDLILASMQADTPVDPENYWINFPVPGTYKISFPEAVSSTAITITHSGSSPYIFSQILPRRYTDGYDIEVNAIKAHHVSADLINAISIQVSDSIVIGPDLIGDKTIDGAKIIDGTISGVLIRDGTIVGNKIYAGTISGSLISANTITAANITVSGITADRLNVAQLDAVAANMGQLVVNSGISIGANGTLWAGAGSANSPTTGLKIYTTAGNSRLTTYNDGTAQIDVGSDGKLRAGAGNVVLDSTGISIGTINTAQSASEALRIYGSGGAGNIVGVAFYNGSYSATNPQATIQVDATNALEIENNAISSVTNFNFPTDPSSNAAVNIYNASLNLKRSPSTPADVSPGAIWGYDSDGTLLYKVGPDKILLHSGAVDTFTVDAASGDITTLGSIDVNGTKFKVTASNGNVVTVGDIEAHGNIHAGPDSHVFAVNGITGDMRVDGLISANGGIEVDSTAFTVANTTGNVSTTGTLNVSGQTTLGALNASGAVGFGASNNKVTIAAATGDTAIAGTLNVTGDVTTTNSVIVGGSLSATYQVRADTELNVGYNSGTGLYRLNLDSSGNVSTVGGISAGTSYNKFTVAAATGNTAIAGTLGVTGKLTASDLAYITLTRTATLSITTAGTTITWTSRTRYNNITYSTTDVTVGNSGYYLVAGTFATVANVSLTMTVARGTVNYTSNLQSTPLSTGNGYIFNFAQVLYLGANSVIKVILTPSANTTLNVNAEGFAGPSPILNIVQLAGI